MPPARGTLSNPIEGPGDYTTTRKVHNDTYPDIDPTTANLSGKAVFVSGASRGLGKSIAISFAKAGASYIAIGARSGLDGVANEIKLAAANAGRKEPQVLRLKLEVTDGQNVTNVFKEIETEFGRLDVVINNAGVLGGLKSIAVSDPDTWWQTMAVNVRGPYLISRACLPLLLKSELKTLITTSSVGAHIVSPTLSDYQTSKLAVLRLTEFLAKENQEAGLVAFTVHPGNMLTDMVGNGETFNPELKAVFTENPELCADSLVYLVKDRREWLNGRYVNVTWDMPELTSPTMVKKIVEGDMLRVRLVTPELYQ